jgi:hypothetical protein
MRYNNWEEAAKASRIKMAISPPERKEIPGGEVLPVRIVKPLRGQPYFTYASCPGLQIRHMTVRTADCDTVKIWEAF